MKYQVQKSTTSPGATALSTSRMFSFWL